LLTLVKALSSLPNREWILEVFGSGPYEGVVKELAERLDITELIHWRGFVPQNEIATELAKVDCVVLPSETRGNWKEQFGRVLIESLACGVPVIGSDSGEIPIIIRESGGGLVFREGDADSCTEKLLEIMTDKEGRLGMEDVGERYVRQTYDLSKLAECFRNAIELYSR
jgi:glycosyltransferase involved in cell wall biosynthesis